MASSPDDDISDVDTSVVENNITAAEFCPDLLNQHFVTPQSCTKDGQLGIKQCHQTCDIYRSQVFNPTPGAPRTCKIDSVDCDPWQCGPCEVVEIQGPLP